MQPRSKICPMLADGGTTGVNASRYTRISAATSVAGTMVGVIGGWALGWFLALDYHKRGPADPTDAPAYVALGLMMLGSLVGALVGLVFGIVLSMRLAHRGAPVQE